MGGIGSLVKMLPGLPGMGRLSGLEIEDKDMGKLEAIIRSMTPQERHDPRIISGSRRARIARGSGTQVRDVNVPGPGRQRADQAVRRRAEDDEDDDPGRRQTQRDVRLAAGLRPLTARRRIVRLGRSERPKCSILDPPRQAGPGWLLHSAPRW